MPPGLPPLFATAAGWWQKILWVLSDEVEFGGNFLKKGHRGSFALGFMA